MRGLNEQEIADIRELRELEKLASIREQQGIKSPEHEKKLLLSDASFLLDEEIKQRDLMMRQDIKQSDYEAKKKLWTNAKEEFYKKIEQEMIYDPD